MPQNGIIATLAEYKETIWLIIPWLAGSITHIFNKIRKGEKMTFMQHVSHMIVSWFAGYMTYWICVYYSIDWPLLWVIIWISSYSWIQIIEAIEMIKAKNIYNIFIDFIKYNINKWGKW